MPVFVIDPLFAQRSGWPRLAYLADALRSLDQQLGGSLVIRHGDPVDVVPAVASEVGARTVHVSRDYGPYGRRRDAAVAGRLTADGRRLRGIGSPYAVDPGTVAKADGSPYAVFTPFSRQWLAVGEPQWAERPSTPRGGEVGWTAPGDVPSDGPPVDPAGRPSEGSPSGGLPSEGLPTSDPAVVHRQWRAFVENGLDTYDEQRDQPGVDGTSRMSVALRWGLVHPCELIDDLAPTRSHDVFRIELAWRDFYADVLFHRPETAWQNLQPKMDAMPVDTDAAARRRFACVGRWDDRVPDRRRRHAPAARDGLDAQPGADDHRQLPRQGPAPAVAVGCAALHAPPGRRRPGLEQPRLAVGGGHRHRRGAVLPGVQPDGAVASGSTPTATTSAAGCPSWQTWWGRRSTRREATDSCTTGAYPPPMVDHAAERNEALARYRSVTSSSR